MMQISTPKATSCTHGYSEHQLLGCACGDTSQRYNKLLKNTPGSFGIAPGSCQITVNQAQFWLYILPLVPTGLYQGLYISVGQSCNQCVIVHCNKSVVFCILHWANKIMWTRAVLLRRNGSNGVVGLVYSIESNCKLGKPCISQWKIQLSWKGESYKVCSTLLLSMYQK